jgi:hypothetical protein
MAGAFVLLRLVVKVSGARIDLQRLRRVHRCQQGGVQTLSFVLTMPIFIVIVLFIVQVSQLMIGIIGVHYAAFAAARAASVWVPAQLIGAPEYDPTLFHVSYREPDPRLENILPPPLSPEVPNRPDILETPVLLGYTQQGPWVQNLRTGSVDTAGNGWCAKYEKIFTAAALGCATISPSMPVETPTTRSGQISQVLYGFYQQLDPAASSNSRIAPRLDNKVAYSWQHTRVEFRFRAKHILNGPTYNPYDHPAPPVIPWVPSEVGWEDPMTLTISHDFALLPGPGRFLAKQIVNSPRPDLTAPLIQRSTSTSGKGHYTTLLTASATVTSEGVKSMRPFYQYP